MDKSDIITDLSTFSSFSLRLASMVDSRLAMDSNPDQPSEPFLISLYAHFGIQLHHKDLNNLNVMQRKILKLKALVEMETNANSKDTDHEVQKKILHSLDTYLITHVDLIEGFQVIEDDDIQLGPEFVKSLNAQNLAMTDDRKVSQTQPIHYNEPLAHLFDQINIESIICIDAFTHMLNSTEKPVNVIKCNNKINHLYKSMESLDMYHDAIKNICTDYTLLNKIQPLELKDKIREVEHLKKNMQVLLKPSLELELDFQL